MIHISTDYVYDGGQPAPYVETDATSPLGVYGRSKLAGEQMLAGAQPQHVILRTAWVHSPFGGNFVKTMLRLAETQDAIRVVDDQIGNPTYAPHLADATLAVAAQIVENGAGAWGIYHAVGGGETSWFGLAEAVFAEAGPLGWPLPAMIPITTQGLSDAGEASGQFPPRYGEVARDVWHCLAGLAGRRRGRGGAACSIRA